MRQIVIRQGRAVVDEIPAPLVEPGTVLVKVLRSCISIGTELSGVRASGAPLWRRAIDQPEKVKRVVQMVAEEGVDKTRSVLEEKLFVGHPTGYSAAGVVLEVGAGVHDLRSGDRVACAGAQCAHHAEVIRVPRNLTARMPDELDFDAASTVTLGAIALQGLRRADPTLGETFVVIGLGILGQLTIQLLRANGCRVIGVDPDRARVDLATSLGMNAGLGGHPDEDVEQVSRLTDGHGADGVIITAASASDGVVSTAFRMCRRKGRVVLVGDVGLDLNRADFYAKELDFFISTSYGPGRYDGNYEERGLDYPVAYVRWTENRNMAEYLRLLADGRVQVKPLVSELCPVAQAGEAYQRIGGDGVKPLMVILEYPEVGDRALPRVVPNPHAKAPAGRRLRLALIGAGGFAKAAHLPNLRSLRDVIDLRAVMSRTGHHASAAAAQFGARYATTDLGHVLADDEVDALLVATRHDSHAEIAAAALSAGKHVLVEKPLALTPNELARLESMVAQPGEHPLLLTGFNRRFSPHAQAVKSLVASRSNPMMISYHMNAGYVPLDHWVHMEQGGGRNRGEACHVYDLFTFLTEACVGRVRAQTIRPATGHYSALDNFVATFEFEDGSVATLLYTALGSRSHPKERMEVFFDGKVVVLDDYKAVTLSGKRADVLRTRRQDKGQRAILERFASAVRAGGDWPIPLWQQAQATRMSFEVDALIGTGS
jgi:predicted dehydrogenase/threonine dehydrogenase-like Zn-dependent dehydrogenase